MTSANWTLKSFWELWKWLICKTHRRNKSRLRRYRRTYMLRLVRALVKPRQMEMLKSWALMLALVRKRKTPCQSWKSMAAPSLCLTSSKTS